LNVTFLLNAMGRTNGEFRKWFQAVSGSAAAPERRWLALVVADGTRAETASGLVFWPPLALLPHRVPAVKK
jgi:hypothetical protein